MSTSKGQVAVLSGIGAARLREQLHNATPAPDGRLVLFLTTPTAGALNDFIEAVIGQLAEIALRMWPTWFTDLRLTAGQAEQRQMIAAVAGANTKISLAWAELAAEKATRGLVPRVAHVAPAVEIDQLCTTINRDGLVLVFDIGLAPANPTVLVHSLEWIARQANVGVVALFPEPPSAEPPFDRLRQNLRGVIVDHTPQAGPPETPKEEGWLDPIIGRPHPLSETEQRLARALIQDPELSSLFRFNQFVDTVRGSRPKVDLLWPKGRFVVEIDGYTDHGTKSAFMRDRNRDYELTCSGYVVLRLVNDEIAQDIAKAIEKIRDIVRVRSARSEQGINLDAAE